MPRVKFTANLNRHLDCPVVDVEGKTLREALDAVFGENPRLRGYVLDDQNCVRRHIAIYVDSRPICDHNDLSDPLEPASEVFVMQALSGG
jgi:molybdopterin synthase sulfur carrier subunit